MRTCSVGLDTDVSETQWQRDNRIDGELQEVRGQLQQLMKMVSQLQDSGRKSSTPSRKSRREPVDIDWSDDSSVGSEEASHLPPAWTSTVKQIASVVLGMPTRSPHPNRCDMAFEAGRLVHSMRASLHTYMCQEAPKRGTLSCQQGAMIDRLFIQAVQTEDTTHCPQTASLVVECMKWGARLMSSEAGDHADRVLRTACLPTDKLDLPQFLRDMTSETKKASKKDAGKTSGGKETETSYSDKQKLKRANTRSETLQKKVNELKKELRKRDEKVKPKSKGEGDKSD